MGDTPPNLNFKSINMEFSISKGCFLSKPMKKGKSVLSKVSFCKLHGETEKDVQIRQKAFDQCWRTIEKTIHEYISKNNLRIFELFKSFLDQSTQRLFGKSPYKDQAIHTALVYGGCNISSNNTLLCELKDHLIECVDSPVVILKESDVAGTNMKSLMKAIMQQLVNWNTDSDDDYDGSSIKLPDCSMSTLCSWYSEYTSEEGRSTPICILIDSFESFPLSVFQDLVAMLSSRKDDFPVILALGSQLPVNIHHLLSNSTLALLSLTEFTTDDTESIVKQLLEKMLLDHSFIVKISPDCCKVLIDNFKYTNLSIVPCMDRLKSIVLDHFYWQPLSYLSTIKPHLLNQYINKMSHCQCEMIRATPSFMNYIEHKDSEMIIKLLNEDSLLKTTVIQLLKRIEDYHVTILPLVEMLSFFTIGTDGNNVVNNKMDIVASLYNTDTLFTVLDSLLECFSVSSTDNFRKCLLNCVTYLNKYTKRNSKHDWVSTVVDDLQRYNNHFDSLLQSSAINYKVIEEVKQRVTHYMKQFFCSHLLSIKTLPLYEIYYYTNVENLVKQVNVSPRQAIIKALITPQHYLKIPDNCADDHTPLPYSSIAYQHYTTMGRVISLPEWMQACCVSEGQSQLLQEQAGFFQSIAEMQFIGLYKSLPQRTNSVLKLCWDTTTV